MGRLMEDRRSLEMVSGVEARGGYVLFEVWGFPCCSFTSGATGVESRRLERNRRGKERRVGASGNMEEAGRCVEGSADQSRVPTEQRTTELLSTCDARCRGAAHMRHPAQAQTTAGAIDPHTPHTASGDQGPVTRPGGRPPFPIPHKST